jgi:hypothetical protein
MLVHDRSQLCEERHQECRTLEKEGSKLQSKADHPMPNGYRTEVDASDELPPELVTRYQGLIGVLRWACELGRVDMVEVLMLSSHNAMPREGHLEAVYHIFAYLKRHAKLNISI